MLTATKLSEKKSFLIQNALAHDMSRVAVSIPHQLVFAELNSDDGIKVSLDKPLGCQEYKPNLNRPAVLRQFFGERKQDGSRSCYGNGSGSLSVGTHPDHLQTRDMTRDMKIISKEIIDILNRNDLGQQLKIDSLNHCTVLFYYHKNSNSPDKMLGFHTDNIYSKAGKFSNERNSQSENTPTCVLTIGDSRNLHFQQQKDTVFERSNHKRWKETKRDHVVLKHNSLFVLHPSDECPYSSGGHRYRWRHGIPDFSGIDDLSIALIFRNVKNTIDTTEDTHRTEQMSCQSWWKGVVNSHKKLASLFLRVYIEKYEQSCYS